MLGSKSSLWAKFGAVGLVLAQSGCDDSATATRVQPAPGAWSGPGISFRVDSTRQSIGNLSFTFDGHADGGQCSFAYIKTYSVSYGIPIMDRTFSDSSAEYAIRGVFQGEESAEIALSWYGYDSQCAAYFSGSRNYAAKPVRNVSGPDDDSVSSGWNFSIAKAETLETALGIAGNLAADGANALVAIHANLSFAGEYAPAPLPASRSLGLINGVRMFSAGDGDPPEALVLGDLSFKAGGEASGLEGFCIGASSACRAMNPVNLDSVILVPPASPFSAVFFFRPRRNAMGAEPMMVYRNHGKPVTLPSSSVPADSGGAPWLRSLSVSQGALVPAFSSQRTGYWDSIPFAAESLSVAAVPLDPSARVSIGGETVSPPDYSLAIGLEDRRDSLAILVRDTGGQGREYVLRLAYGKPYIRSLVPSAGSLVPTFSAGHLRYDLPVPPAEDSITLALSFPAGVTGWKLGNLRFPFDDTLVTEALAAGANAFAIVVYGGGDSARYELSVQRPERKWQPVSVPAEVSGSMKWVKDIQRHPVSQAIYVMGTGFPNVTVTPGAPLPFIDISRSDPGGKTWAKLNHTDGTTTGPGFMASDSRCAMAMAYGDAAGLSALSNAGLPFATHDSGKTWVPMPMPMPGGRAAGLFNGGRNSKSMYVASASGLWRGDGSSAWQRLDSALSFVVSDFSTADDKELFVVTRKSAKAAAGIHHSPDGGSTWSALLSDSSVLCIQQMGSAPRILLAGTTGRGVLRSADEGKSWNPSTGAIGTVRIQAILVSIRDAKCAYAATSNGVFKSTDQGATWLPLPKSGLSTAGINAILEDTATADGLWIGTQGGGVYRW